MRECYTQGIPKVVYNQGIPKVVYNRVYLRVWYNQVYLRVCITWYTSHGGVCTRVYLSGWCMYTGILRVCSMVYLRVCSMVYLRVGRVYLRVVGGYTPGW